MIIGLCAKVSYVLVTLRYFLPLYEPWNIFTNLGPVLAGTRAQSDDRYGSGTLHSEQVLRGSFPLLFLAFKRPHFRRQMPPRPQQREHS
jgi:hypothetical protein